MTKIKKDNLKPGFTRVYDPKRDKTIRLLDRHAYNQEYLNTHGLQLLETPVMPPEVIDTAPLNNTKKPNHGSKGNK